MNFMFPEKAQKEIANLHIAFAAGLKANKVYSHLNKNQDMLKNTIEIGVITFCDEIEATRVEGINKLIDDLAAKAGKKTKAFYEIFRDVMGTDAQWDSNGNIFAERYENIVHEANLNGANIYDACVVYTHKYSTEVLDEAILAVLDACEEENFNLKVVCNYNEDARDYKGKVLFYTTTKATALVKSALKGIDSYWDHERTYTYFYAQPLLTNSIESSLEVGDQTNYVGSALNLDALIQIESVRSNSEEDRLKEVARIFTKSGNKRVNYESTNFMSGTSDNVYYPIDEVLDNQKLFGISDWTVDVIKG